MFRSFGIKSLFMPMEGEAGGSSGGGSDGGTGVDVDAETGQPVAIDTDGEGGGKDKGVEEPPAGGEGADEPFSLQIGDDVYSEEQVLDAFKAFKEREDWTGKLTKRSEDLNAMERSLEENRRRLMGGDRSPHTPGGQPSGQPGGEDRMMTGEELRTMILDNPDQAVTTLNNLITQTAQGIVAQMMGTQESKNFAQKHFSDTYPEYEKTLHSQEFRQFHEGLPIDPSSGAPIYGTVNAYLAYELSNAKAQLDDLGKQIEEAKKQGFLKGQEHERKNIVAKGRVKLLKGQGHGQPSPHGKDVKDMSQDERLNAATRNVLKMREAKANMGG